MRPRPNSRNPQERIEPERAGGERLGRQTAEHHEVGRRHEALRRIGDDERPTQAKRFGDFSGEPGTTGGAAVVVLHGFGRLDPFHHLGHDELRPPGASQYYISAAPPNLLLRRKQKFLLAIRGPKRAISEPVFAKRGSEFVEI